MSNGEEECLNISRCRVCKPGSTLINKTGGWRNFRPVIFTKNVPNAESAILSALICLSNPEKTAFLNMIMTTAKVAASVQMSVLQMQLK